MALAALVGLLAAASRPSYNPQAYASYPSACIPTANSLVFSHRFPPERRFRRGVLAVSHLKILCFLRLFFFL